MARIRFSEDFFGTGLGGREMAFGHLFISPYANSVATAAYFGLFDDAENSTVFGGNGLAYSRGGPLQQVNGVTGGQVTGVRWEVGGANVITVTGLLLTGPQFSAAFFSFDPRVMEAALLSGDDNIAGTTKADYIRGGAGDDLMMGLQGADILLGGRGDDTLTGGSGADVFLFAVKPDAAGNVDRITDFSVAADTMQLENGVFVGLGAAGALNGRYTEGTSATEQNDRIVYDQARGRVYFDADGVGGTGKVLFAIVDAGTNLTQADFLVI